MSRESVTHRVSLVTTQEEIVPDLFRRLLVVIVLILLVTAVLWVDRDGLRDNAHPGEPLSFTDVLYFAVVTLTTVGYGDIIPVSDRARLIGTLIVTPVRVFIFIIFIGTAYQLVIQRYREAYQMRRIHERLKDHIIICGYGVKGHATVTELKSYGHAPEDIVVIDPSQEVVEDAAADGLVALRGNATSEATLRAAVIERAKNVVIDVDRDDTTVLICLTAKHLNPDVCVVAAAREAENVPLIYRSGADVVVAPPIAGGRMLAIATQLPHAPRFLDDIITFGRGLDFGERTIEPSEAGLTIDQLSNLAGKLPIGAYHQGKRHTFNELTDLHFDTGDVIIYLAAKPQAEEVA